ncbi:MAG: crossover junction endodeoxyribonuclease RuvC [Deltaproteobacteria bacterium]|nr:crossover junction endodeoxyribonuclease RuvC [Deltaproteobacteria bacterium]RLB63252.1 MAG: crossover junction endodeoxyribonuclease RuvC [Deltaproteobacteria bacterium]
MRILGIDPGTRITGYGIIDVEGNRLRHVDNGIIKTRSSDVLPTRLKAIYDGLTSVLKEFSPEAVAVEQVFMAKNPRAALTLGHARGTAVIAAVNLDLEVHEYSALQVKSAVVGYGHAGKQQVQHMVKALLNLPEVAQEDAADALAVAICHANSRTLRQAVSSATRR